MTILETPSAFIVASWQLAALPLIGAIPNARWPKRHGAGGNANADGQQWNHAKHISFWCGLL